MVRTYTKPLDDLRMQPRFFYISGCDGTGKTTQTELLMSYLRSREIPVKHLWLRFPFFLSIPLLLYARLNGYSWHEKFSEVSHGYWKFHNSWLLRNVFPWLLFFDAALAAIFKIYLPMLFGKNIVCERFILDMLVDLSLALEDIDFYQKLPGRLYFRLLPKNSSIVILDLESEIIRERRQDLVMDKRLEARLISFRYLAKAHSHLVLSSRMSKHEVNQCIMEIMGM